MMGRRTYDSGAVAHRSRGYAVVEAVHCGDFERRKMIFEEIRDGVPVQWIDIDGLVIEVPDWCMVPALSRQIEQAMNDAGLTTVEMLADLRVQRALYVKEKYGIMDD